MEAPSRPPPTGEGFCCALSSSPSGGDKRGAYSSPSRGRLGGGFSLFDNAKVLIIWQPDKQVAYPVRSEKWEKRKVAPSHRNGATFALE